MKHNLLRILAAVLALTMLFSLAACGGSDGSSSSDAGSSESSNASDVSGEESSMVESSSEESSESSAVEIKYATVKAFLEDPTVKASLDKSIEGMVENSNAMTVSLEGTDDTLIYVFKFTDEAMAATDEESLKTALAEELEKDSFINTFQQIAGLVSSVVEAGNAKVKAVYAKADGTELVSREYTAG